MINVGNVDWLNTCPNLATVSIEAPGFFIVDGKLIATNINVEKPDKEDVKQALEILNELGEKCFSSSNETFH